jgi:hypothetical protein
MVAYGLSMVLLGVGGNSFRSEVITPVFIVDINIVQKYR